MRVGRMEKLGVGLTVLVLLGTTLVILGLQVRSSKETPKDPRLVAGAELSEQSPAEEEPSSQAEPVSEAPGTSEGAEEGAAEEVPGEESTAEEGLPETEPSPAAAPAQAPAEPPASLEASAPAEPPAEEPPAPQAKGSLIVNSYPWSQVSIDGKALGRTPLADIELPAGEHSVRLVFPTMDDHEYSTTVTIKAGEVERVVHRLPKPTDESP